METDADNHVPADPRINNSIGQVLSEAKKATHLVCPHCAGHVEMPKPIDHIMGGVFAGLGNVAGSMMAGQLITVRRAENILKDAGYVITKPEKKNGARKENK